VQLTIVDEGGSRALRREDTVLVGREVELIAVRVGATGRRVTVKGSELPHQLKRAFNSHQAVAPSALHVVEPGAIVEQRLQTEPAKGTEVGRG
jgi:hypothetical protein